VTTQFIKDLTDAEAGWGTISYGNAENTFTFNGLRHFSLQSEQVYDEAQRTVIANDYTLVVVSMIYGSDVAGESANIAEIRKTLSLAGQTLILKNVGLSDIQVNGAGQNFDDIQWGPKPKSVVFRGAGGVLAYEVTWTVEFRIFDQEIVGDLVAFNYGVTYSFDGAGLCTRIIEGYLQVPLNRGDDGGYDVTETADTFRDNYVNFDIPDGFRRLPQTYRLSPDRTREDFVIIDAQLDCVDESPPPNALIADLDFDLQSQGPGFAQSNITLSGEIEVPSGCLPSAAARAFVLVALDRWTKISQSFNDTSPALVIPTALHVGRKMFSRKSRFFMSWTVTGCLNDLLNQGGIWEPVDGYTTSDWQNSIINSGAWGVRGTAALVYNADNDAIIDLGNSSNETVDDQTSTQSTVGQGTGSIFSLDDIDPTVSWLHYSNHLRVYRDRKVTQHKPAASYTPSNPDSTNNVTNPNANMPQITASNNDVYQDQSTPTDMVLMQGKALRIQFPPAVPNLLTVGGQQVEEIKRVVDGPRPIGCIFGTTVYAARWAILYRVVNGYIYSTRSNTAETNPSLCCETSPSVE
jgi:hypothetical protein